MADQKPLVIAPDPFNQDGSAIIQQLQSGNDLDIPLQERVAKIELQLRELAIYLSANGIEVPEDLL